MTQPLTAATSSILVEDVKDWRGQDVIDRGSDKLGKLDEVYYDTEVDLPAFAAVKSGLLGKQLTLVPLLHATVGQSYLRVNVSKDQFKEAPSFDPDAELTADDEARAFGYYGLDYRAAADGARRLAKH
jgi:hypothetical protein